MPPNVSKKPRLRIHYGNPYVFAESLLPALPALAQKFEIHLSLEESAHWPDSLLPDLEVLKKSSVIERMWIFPAPRSLISRHLFLAGHIRENPPEAFDLLLLGTESEVAERYLINAVQKKVVVVVYWPALGYVLLNQWIESGAVSASNPPQPEPLRKKIQGLTVGQLIRKILLRILSEVRRAAWLLRLAVLRRRKAVRRWFDRRLLPLLLRGSSFADSPLDRITSASGGRADYVLFCDTEQPRAFKALFAEHGQTGTTFLTVRHPGARLACDCDTRGPQESKKNLLLLTSFSEKRRPVPESLLRSILRDTLVVAQATGQKIFDVRSHPRSNRIWDQQIITHLRAHGIVIDDDHAGGPIAKIACSYQTAAGFGSSAVHVFRAACRRIRIVRFEEATEQIYPGSRAMDPLEEGIHWLRADGSNAAAIFQEDPASWPQPPEMSLEQVLTAIVEDKGAAAAKGISNG